MIELLVGSNFVLLIMVFTLHRKVSSMNKTNINLANILARGLDQITGQLDHINQKVPPWDLNDYER